MLKSWFCLKILEDLTLGHDQPDLRMYFKLKTNKKRLKNKTPSSIVNSLGLVFLSEK